MHTCGREFTSPFWYLKFHSWYKVEICSRDDLDEMMTIVDVKIKIYLILKIVFPLVCLLENRDTEERSIPNKLEYRKKHHSAY